METLFWARSSVWLERSTDNRKVVSSNLIGPNIKFYLGETQDGEKMNKLLAILLTFGVVLPGCCGFTGHTFDTMTDFDSGGSGVLTVLYEPDVMAITGEKDLQLTIQSPGYNLVEVLEENTSLLVKGCAVGPIDCTNLGCTIEEFSHKGRRIELTANCEESFPESGKTYLIFLNLTATLEGKSEMGEILFPICEVHAEEKICRGEYQLTMVRGY